MQAVSVYIELNILYNRWQVELHQIDMKQAQEHVARHKKIMMYWYGLELLSSWQCMILLLHLSSNPLFFHCNRSSCSCTIEF
jgi:hypothetical protein